MKKKFAAFAAAVLMLMTCAVPVKAQELPWDTLETGAKACVVMEARTGRILGGHDIHKRLPMASTTKIMGAMLALEEPELDTFFTVDASAIQTEGSSMGLSEGDQVTLRSLVYGMMLPSGNDAANAAAVRIADSVPDFVERMNLRAKELELEDTHFVTPSGLDAPGHYSSAYDMAKLTAEAMKNETFREICCLSAAQVSFGNPPRKRWLKNYNKLLTLYPHCIGVKTGFTEDAYRCLVSAARLGEMELICVTLNCADDWAVHQNLYERYFTQMEFQSAEEEIPDFLPICNKGLLSDGMGVRGIPVRLEGSPMLPCRKGETLTCQILSNPVLFAPVQEGQVLGEAVFFLDGKQWFSQAIVADKTVLSAQTGRKALSLIDRMRDFIIQLF